MAHAWLIDACCATIPWVKGAPSLVGLPAPGDGELVARARRDEAWAREAIYRRHVGAIAAVLVRLLGRREEAEDAVQDTFLVAFTELARLRDTDALRPWLIRIAVHQAHRRFRRRRLRRLLGLDRARDDATLESLAAPGTSPEVRAELALLDRALAALLAAPRVAWVLRYVEGYDLEGVAHACGCSLATAKRRIAAARARVSAHLEVPTDVPGDVKEWRDD
ncbi:MAG: RNA polymerase sigma factor [Deltaproteobacteria bacterium]|nr:RNA polymerase sigma factor [Deltaproteobacteria bacterium]